MSDPLLGFGYGDIPRRLLRNRFIWVLAIISCVIELYDVALLPAFTSTQKARETTAVAENAVMRQAAEANRSYASEQAIFFPFLLGEVIRPVRTRPAG